MGLPGSDTTLEFRVIDLYRREGDKLAENWIFIDMLHVLKQQGMDVLARLDPVTHRWRLRRLTRETPRDNQSGQPYACHRLCCRC